MMALLKTSVDLIREAGVLLPAGLVAIGLALAFSFRPWKALCYAAVGSLAVTLALSAMELAKAIILRNGPPPVVPLVDDAGRPMFATLLSEPQWWSPLVLGALTAALWSIPFMVGRRKLKERVELAESETSASARD